MHQLLFNLHLEHSALVAALQANAFKSLSGIFGSLLRDRGCYVPVILSEPHAKDVELKTKGGRNDEVVTHF